MTRSPQHPVEPNKDGKVPPKRRAAALKEAIRIYTQENTTAVQCEWKEKDNVWQLKFTDE